MIKKLIYLYNTLFFIKHKDNSTELVQTLLYKINLPNSTNDCYYFHYPYVKNDFGNECNSKYLTKINLFNFIKLCLQQKIIINF